MSSLSAAAVVIGASRVNSVSVCLGMIFKMARSLKTCFSLLPLAMIKLDDYRAISQTFHESTESKILVFLFLMDSRTH